MQAECSVGGFVCLCLGGEKGVVYFEKNDYYPNKSRRELLKKEDVLWNNKNSEE